MLSALPLSARCVPSICGLKKGVADFSATR